MRNKFIVIVIIILISFVIMNFSVLKPYFFNMSYDVLTGLKTIEKKSNNIIIIGIDDTSINLFDKTNAGFIPRDIYAKFIEKMSLYNPKLIAFDILFDVKIGEHGHELFIDAIKKYSQNIIFGSYFKAENDGITSNKEKYITPGYEIGLENLSWGYVSIFRGIPENNDGIRRNFRPYEVYNDNLIYSMPLAITKKYANARLDLSENKIAIYELKSSNNEPDQTITTKATDGGRENYIAGGTAYIKYPGHGTNCFNVISFKEIINAAPEQDKIFEKIMKDKIILVGSLSPRHRDIHYVPAAELNFAAAKRQEYGVFILAGITDNILNRNLLRALPQTPDILILAFFIVIFTLIFARLKLLPGAFILIFGILTNLFIAYHAFDINIIYNFLNYSCAITLTFIMSSAWQYYESLSEYLRLKKTFYKYVSPEVVNLITRKEFEKSSQGVKKVITVLFSDIRGFTPMSEKMDPKAISLLLNEYFNKMTEVIFKNRGTIDKFIGDAIMVVFGAPLDQEDAPLRAVRTALEMKRELEILKQKWLAEGSTSINIGIGINTGEAFVGNIGSDIHKEYTAIGDNVNIAARLESTAKAGQILISESTLKSISKNIEYLKLEPVKLKGKSNLFEIYEVTKIIDGK